MELGTRDCGCVAFTALCYIGYKKWKEHRAAKKAAKEANAADPPTTASAAAPESDTLMTPSGLHNPDPGQCSAREMEDMPPPRIATPPTTGDTAHMPSQMVVGTARSPPQMVGSTARMPSPMAGDAERVPLKKVPRPAGMAPRRQGAVRGVRKAGVQMPSGTEGPPGRARGRERDARRAPGTEGPVSWLNVNGRGWDELKAREFGELDGLD